VNRHRLRGYESVPLEALSGWAWDVSADSWEEAFSSLCRFSEREGHGRVPRGFVEEGYRLGQWVSKQRAAHANGTLDPDRVARLEALPGWVWGLRLDLWEEGFSHLCQFVQREGHARVPTDYIDDGYRLGQWVHGQRAAYGRLDSDRVAKLEALPGWVWNKHVGQWEEGLSHLCRFCPARRSRPRAKGVQRGWVPAGLMGEQTAGGQCEREA
jgi:hypothetical protein